MKDRIASGEFPETSPNTHPLLPTPPNHWLPPPVWIRHLRLGLISPSIPHSLSFLLFVFLLRQRCHRPSLFICLRHLGFVLLIRLTPSVSPWKSTGCRQAEMPLFRRLEPLLRLATLRENCFSQRANPTLPFQSRITSLLFASVLVCLLCKSRRCGWVLFLDRGYFIHRVSAE